MNGFIKFVIKDYNQIFNEFDPSPYQERVLSTHFLDELKQSSKTRENVHELRLLVSGNVRSLKDEEIIKNRLNTHFEQQYQQYISDINQRKIVGILSLLVGFALLHIGAKVYDIKDKPLYLNLLYLVLEASGWFLVWQGLDKTFSFKNKEKIDTEFSNKMHGIKIIFDSY